MEFEEEEYQGIFLVTLLDWSLPGLAPDGLITTFAYPDPCYLVCYSNTIVS